jgi:hypothetical protein
MIFKIIFVIAALVAVFLVIVALQPSRFRIERSVTIAAPASAIFPHVNTARGWEAWSPWPKSDPTMKVTYEGPDAGVGSVTAFTGDKAGVGRATIVESRETDLIRYRLDMLKPMTATSTADFTFKRSTHGTVVTWAMYGDQTFVGKAFGLFVNCDKMVGGEFENGLNNLKSIVERQSVVSK